MDPNTTEQDAQEQVDPTIEGGAAQEVPTTEAETVEETAPEAVEA